MHGLPFPGPCGEETVETIMNFQGKEKFLQHLYEDKDLYNLFERAVYGEEITVEQYMGVQ
jgi:hypothetical protein